MIILNFHGVGPVPRNLDAAEHNCWLDLTDFEAVLDLVQGQSQVQLTFDDGNASDIKIALPSLIQRGLKAAFFICSGRLGLPDFLNHSHISELLAQGMSIGSHGVAHRSWRHLPSSLLVTELVESRQALEKICGRPVVSAACPFGAYDRTVLRGLRQAGYRLVYTSDGGAALPNRCLQPRTTVTRLMSLADVQRLIEKGPGVCRQWSINTRKLLKRLR